MEKFKVRIKDTDRKFVRVYQDFLHNTVLTASEKMVYIALKSFVDFSYDGGQVFPSMDTLCTLTSLKERTVRDTINSLIKKGIVQKKRRGLTKTNIYTLSDNSEIWNSKTPEELKESASKEGITLSTEELLAELQRRGAIEILDKEKDPTPDTDQSTEVEPKNKQFSVVNNTNNYEESQWLNLTLEDVKKHYGYSWIVEMSSRQGIDKTQIDRIMKALHKIFTDVQEEFVLHKPDRKIKADKVRAEIWERTNTNIYYIANKVNEDKPKYLSNYLVKCLYDFDSIEHGANSEE